MEILQFDEFMSRTFGGRPNHMDTTYYAGSLFQCGCGKNHPFDYLRTPVIRELPKMRIVIKVYECGFVNCIKVRGVFWFKGFKTLFSTIDGTE
jgi:hypothetical protein